MMISESKIIKKIRTVELLYDGSHIRLFDGLRFGIIEK